MTDASGAAAPGGVEPRWDLPDPFAIDVVVSPADIDRYGHTNNAVYLGWCDQVAWAHSEAVGLDWERFQQLGRAMAVRRSELEYLAPSHAGETVRVANWIVRCDGRVRATRRYQLCRAADGLTLLRGDIHFVCIDLESGRPRRMPPEFRERYRVLDSVRRALDGAGV